MSHGSKGVKDLIRNCYHAIAYAVADHSATTPVIARAMALPGGGANVTTKGQVIRMFAIHPGTAERIARLRNMAHTKNS